MRQEIPRRLGLESINPGAGVGGSRGWLETRGSVLNSYTPIDGSLLAAVREVSAKDYETVMETAQQAFLRWRMTPAPVRGQVVREMGEALREHKNELGALVSLEMGKIKPEGQGEVQEMLDIADLAVGLSRQLYGLTMHSERPHHRLYEQWHPLGLVGVVTAFNFPVAVWSWNALIAAVCGDVVIWKPSSKTPLTALAVMNLIGPVVDKYDLQGVFNVLIGRVQLPGLEHGAYVQPALVEAFPDLPVMREETFAPILYVVTYQDFGEALRIHNAVDQGLSSSIFTGSLYDAERFLSHEGSDCGIANVNVGTSGAEIGGAFGGEKDTGGGRESGSDAWKSYMRRQTSTINWGHDLPLAQGVSFNLG